MAKRTPEIQGMKANGDTSRAGALRFKLTDNQLRALTVERYPQTDDKGKVSFITNPTKDGKGKPQPYQFLDTTPGAIPGFGVYVGSRGASFRVRRRYEDRFIKLVVGSVQDLTLEEAHDLARSMWADVVRSQGDQPSRVKRAAKAVSDVRRVTVAQCIARYLEHLRSRSQKAKQNSIDSVEKSLARLARPEVNIASKEVRDLNRKMLIEAWNNVRTTSLARSSRVSKDVRELVMDEAKVKAVLGVAKPWYELDAKDLIALGVTGRMIARVTSAGLAAAEHTFSDASRGVRMVVMDELRSSDREDRKPELRINPFEELEDHFRSQTQLRAHYKAAEVRNPLGEENASLPKVLKAIIGRRNEQGGNNRAAADYLLLTLLFGSRRTEGARLKWFDQCTKDEITLGLVSWVWITDDESMVNPHTLKSGSQVYFHDTKNGDERHLPVCYFAKKILQQRLGERDLAIKQAPKRIAAAKKAWDDLKELSLDMRKRALAEKKYEIELARQARLIWVFPARSLTAKSGYYSSPKSILNNVRQDAGLLDLDKEIDIGLTPHDLRRTLGRYAGHLLSGAVISQLLNHRIKDGTSKVSDLYTTQEWAALREALGKVEEHMIATSPRVWNLLKGTDKPRLDEANDPAPTLFKSKKVVDLGGGDGEDGEDSQGMDGDE